MKPLLIDIDGVLRIGNSPAPGLNQFLTFIQNNKIPSCIISNSTLSHSNSLKKFFADNGIDLTIPMMTAADATYEYVKSRYNSAAVYCTNEVKKLFEGMINYSQPECVVVGDLGKDWDFNIMNEIFNFVLEGADFIAMQKNKFWKTPEEGYLLDAGAFVAAIEYASGKNAELIGKPSGNYFNAALAKTGYTQSNSFIMIGDDLITDIQGANNLGGETILIYTGKTNFPYDKNLGITPNHETMDLFETIEILKGIYK